jgi:hypothetical protein
MGWFDASEYLVLETVARDRQADLRRAADHTVAATDDSASRARTPRSSAVTTERARDGEADRSPHEGRDWRSWTRLPSGSFRVAMRRVP